nr:MAG TPA: restriction alleviation protein [Caudoviricetes sp.]
MNHKNLERCPFCGSPVEMISRPLFEIPMVICTNKYFCGAALSFVGAGTEEAVIERWNERKKAPKSGI